MPETEMNDTLLARFQPVWQLHTDKCTRCFSGIYIYERPKLVPPNYGARWRCR